MTTTVLLRLPADPASQTEEAAYWCLLEASTEVYCGTLAEFAQSLRDKTIATNPKVIALLPAEEVLLTQITTPAVSRKQLQQLAPFAIEDHLIETIEQQHFALGIGDKQDNKQLQLPLAVIQQKRMQQRLAQLEAHGIATDTLTSEAFCLNTDNHWTLLLEKDRPALFRYNATSALCIETDSLLTALEILFVANKDNLPESCVVHDFADTEPAFKERLQSLFEQHVISCEWQAYQGQALSLLAQEIRLEKNINLRQGSFSRQQQYSRLWKPWRLSAALAAMMLIILPITLHLNYKEKQRQLHYLNEQMIQTFKQTFPDARKIVNPRAQMENRLRVMQRGNGNSSNDFLQLLARSAPPLAASSKTQIENIRFKSGKITLGLKIDSFESLDTLKKNLSASGLLVDIQSATASNDQVKAQLSISEATS